MTAQTHTAETLSALTEAEIVAITRQDTAASGTNPDAIDEGGRTFEQVFEGWVEYLSGMHKSASRHEVVIDAALTLMSFNRNDG